MKFVCLRYCSMRGCRLPPGRESLALFPLVTNAAANVATASRELCPGSAPEAIRRRWQTGQPMIVAVASCTSLIGSDENVVRQRARAPSKEMECRIIPIPDGPDLTLGIAQDKLADGAKLLGHVGEEEVLLVRIGSEFFAVGAHCTHYHGPLVEGLVVGDTIRCPWHHACFDLRTGESLRAPAFDPLPCWVVELRNDRVFVRNKNSQPKALKIGKPASDTPRANCNCRRGRRRLCRRRNAAATRLCGQYRDLE